MANTISNTDEVIDSRDILRRIEELESEKSDLISAITDATEALSDNEDDSAIEELETTITDAKEALKDWDDSDEGEEYKILKELAEDCENITGEFHHGETLINEDYFTDYIREQTSDIGDMPKNIPSYIAIDWEKTAENCKADYSEVEFDGQTYLIRD